LLVYGANGYTGQLIVEECVRRGLQPVLAGIMVVVHAAGPFFRTSAPMVRACLAAEVHCLDITGEIAVFEACCARREDAKQAGVVIMPGLGFDVVPTDCLAARLADRLPDAQRLELAFAGECASYAGGRAAGRVSHAVVCIRRGVPRVASGVCVLLGA